MRKFDEGHENSGRPRSRCFNDNVQEEIELIEDDNRLSRAYISLPTGTEERSVNRIFF